MSKNAAAELARNFYGETSGMIEYIKRMNFQDMPEERRQLAIAATEQVVNSFDFVSKATAIFTDVFTPEECEQILAVVKMPGWEVMKAKGVEHALQEDHLTSFLAQRVASMVKLMLDEKQTAGKEPTPPPSSGLT